MNTEVKKAAKWIIRSGVLTTFLSGLAALFVGLQSGQYDFRFFIYGFFILVVNSSVNLVDYYNHESNKI